MTLARLTLLLVTLACSTNVLCPQISTAGANTVISLLPAVTFASRFYGKKYKMCFINETSYLGQF